MEPRCPQCNKNVCDCDWGLDELFKNWRLDTSEVMDAQLTGSDCYCSDATDSCSGLPVFSSTYANIGKGLQNPHPRSYQGPVIGQVMYKVGDLVRYYPLWGLGNWDKPWVIKQVFCTDPLDCAFYDYEITDGRDVHLVTYYEIKKMEEK